MKVLLGAVVLMAGLGLAGYYFGGLHGFDATKQGKEARAKIGPGMKWTAVLDITGDPSHFRPMIAKMERIGGEDREIIVVGPNNKFSRGNVTQRLADKSLPHGFLCSFHYSEQEAFTVTFDGDGLVASVEDAVTMADLLQTRE